MAIPIKELAWASGFVDGEGCIHAKDSRTARQIRVVAVLTVSNTVPHPIRKLRRIFGCGAIHVRKSFKRHRTAFIWKVYDQKAAQVLRQLIPYLVNKRKEAHWFVCLMELRSKWQPGTAKSMGRVPYKRHLQVALIKRIGNEKTKDWG